LHRARACCTASSFAAAFVLVPGVGHELAARVGEEAGYPHVDADHAAGRRQRFGRGLLGSQDDVPAPPFTLDRDRLYLADHRTVLVHLDVADALEADAGDGVVPGGIPPATVLREVHGVEPLARPEARIPAGNLRSHSNLAVRCC
jgi:hypothetical protein